MFLVGTIKWLDVVFLVGKIKWLDVVFLVGPIKWLVVLSVLRWNNKVVNGTYRY